MENKNITGDGTTTISTTPGRRYTFVVAGTFGSGTMTLKWSDGTNDVAFTDGAFTADGGIEVVAPTDTIKAVLASSTSPDLLISLIPVKQEIYR